MSDFRNELYELRLLLALYSLLFAVVALIAAIEGKVGGFAFGFTLWLLYVGFYFLGKRKSGH